VKHAVNTSNVQADLSVLM